MVADENMIVLLNCSISTIGPAHVLKAETLLNF